MRSPGSPVAGVRVSAASGALERIEQQRVIPVLRTRDAEDAVATARACVRGGMGVIELTYSIPNVEEALVDLARDEGIVVGVGTVTAPAQVDASVDLGARFLVSYGFDPEVIASAVERGVPMIPGGLTPSEVAGCRRAGAAAVKLFPARLVEPSYIRDLRAVMPDLKVMVTGGIPSTPEGIRPWLADGAMAVGLGSALGTAADDGADEVERRCRALVRIGLDDA
jgi:2-dehydro-3-deoxyphosphogluconate aldolase / (4S)-4-hydroxy-2-oxoglutarate aldolase